MIEVLNLFNAIVATKSQVDLSCANIGVVTDFTITPDVEDLFIRKFKPLPITTLFSKTERLNSDPIDLIRKQILNYIKTYGLGIPGLFDLEVTEGVVIKPTFVQAITVRELEQKVQNLLYSNRPIKNTEELTKIVKSYNLSYDFDSILNNEMRIRLYDETKHVFKNGDEAIRYLVFVTTGNTLVIKNTRQIEEIKKESYKVKSSFFTVNETALSEVFNRFKPILLAFKKTNATAINRIARKSKTNHVPIKEGFNKRFLSVAIENLDNLPNLVAKLDVRDKFKILSLIEFKFLGLTFDAFTIRNGSVHIKKDRKVIDTTTLYRIKDSLLESLKDDLKVLKGKKILLDPNVKYGLPISRKQAIGNLPYGTTVTLDGEICSGIYWENDWGANDLDLSTVDTNGNRTGWGGWSGYGNNDVVYSGDQTYAPNGAMEFMTSKTGKYGLFVNTYSGNNEGVGLELVIGQGKKDRWITDVKIREKTETTGRGSILGFVNDTTFTVYQGKVSNRIANFGERNPIISKVLASTWTINSLLDALGIHYDTVAKEENYDFNLSYSSFSFDKLEELVYS